MSPEDLLAVARMTPPSSLVLSLSHNPDSLPDRTLPPLTHPYPKPPSSPAMPHAHFALSPMPTEGSLPHTPTTDAPNPFSRPSSPVGQVVEKKLHMGFVGLGVRPLLVLA